MNEQVYSLLLKVGDSNGVLGAAYFIADMAIKMTVVICVFNLVDLIFRTITKK
jgi:hypothetical protein